MAILWAKKEDAILLSVVDITNLTPFCHEIALFVTLCHPLLFYKIRRISTGAFVMCVTGNREPQPLRGWAYILPKAI